MRLVKPKNRALPALGLGLALGLTAGLGPAHTNASAQTKPDTKANTKADTKVKAKAKTKTKRKTRIEADKPSPKATAHAPVDLPQARKARKPNQLKGVGIDEQLGETLPLDLQFTNTRGQKVKLGKFFKKGRPVVLNLAYLHCPQLCPMIMQGMGKAMKQMDWDLGDQYEVITVSFDPKDGPIAAKKRQQKMLRSIGKPADAEGWNFLVGDEKQIEALTDAIGFRYKKLSSRSRQFAHTAVVMIVSPEGKLTRYLKGVRFPSKTLRLSLVDASNGEVGSFLDQALLFCCRFSTKDTKYVATAESLMTAGGAVTLLIFSGVLGLLFMRERKRRREEPEQRIVSKPG